MNKSPCLNCKDRYPGCSVLCKKEDYLKDRERRKTIRDTKHREYERNKPTETWRKKNFGKQEG